MKPVSGGSFKIVVVGELGSGKSALVWQFCTNQFVADLDPTLEDNYRKQCIIDEETCIIDILDTSEHGEEFSALRLATLVFVSLSSFLHITCRDQWVRDSDAFLIVFSITDRSSFESTISRLDQINRWRDADYGDLNVILVGAKIDLEESRVVSREEAETLSKRFKVTYMECSSKNRIHVGN